MGTPSRLLIGEIAKQAGVNRETLRYYERLGLLSPQRRTGAGYRIYGTEAVERLRFIKRSKGIGFSLEEIRELLDMRPESPRNCNRVFKMLDRKLDELEAQIVGMKHFHKQLSQYRNRCNDAMKQGRACPVIVEVSDSSQNTG